MKSGEWNNGIIEVIHPEAALAMPPKVHVDEVLINGRRYRIPEKVIVMDFWNKAGKGPLSEHEYVLSLFSVLLHANVCQG